MVFYFSFFLTKRNSSLFVKTHTPHIQDSVISIKKIIVNLGRAILLASGNNITFFVNYTSRWPFVTLVCKSDKNLWHGLIHTTMYQLRHFLFALVTTDKMLVLEKQNNEMWKNQWQRPFAPWIRQYQPYPWHISLNNSLSTSTNEISTSRVVGCRHVISVWVIPATGSLA